jgi:hypothetical protein
MLKRLKEKKHFLKKSTLPSLTKLANNRGLAMFIIHMSNLSTSFSQLNICIFSYWSEWNIKIWKYIDIESKLMMSVVPGLVCHQDKLREGLTQPNIISWGSSNSHLILERDNQPGGQGYGNRGRGQGYKGRVGSFISFIAK